MKLLHLLETTASFKKLVIIPGGFHPFHPGHKSLYAAAKATFPDADIYYAASNDTSARPFPFEDKIKLASAAGVPVSIFKKVNSPFRSIEITEGYDPSKTVLIFIRSEKDRNVPPIPGGTKKDGSPLYFQPLPKNFKNLKPMDQSGYIAYLPVVKFPVAHNNLTNASQIRQLWPTASAAAKQQIISKYYAQDPKTAYKILNRNLNISVITESQVVEFHNQLNPKLWKNNQLKPAESNHLKAIAAYFIESIGLDKLNVVDVTITGSNAAYTYTNTSDIDLHINVDVDLTDKELLKLFFDAKKNLFNFQHDLEIHKLPVELYIQMNSESHVSNGLYSLLKNQWLEPPTKKHAQVHETAVIAKYHKIVNQIKSVIKNHDLYRANSIKRKIYKYRRAGLSEHGEWGVENLTFKMLRNKGWLDKLTEFSINNIDRKLSLEGRYAK